MEGTVVKHVSDFIRHIEKQSEGYRLSHTMLFRGENRVGYPLLPSVYRRKIVEAYDTYTYLATKSEGGLIQSFIADAASYVNTLSTDDQFSWLEYAQHFGVPTRLLDWTSNPLIALYFACFPGNCEDGKVYLLHPHFLQQLAMKDNKNQMLGKVLKKETVKMIWENEKGFPYPMVFRPYYIDQRMRAQASWFMVWGNRKEPLDRLIEELEKDGKGHALFRSQITEGVTTIGDKEETALSHIIISGEYKKNLLHELDRLGINQSTVFPGLDGVGKAIEWRYNASNREHFDFL